MNEAVLVAKGSQVFDHVLAPTEAVSIQIRARLRSLARKDLDFRTKSRGSFARCE